MVLRVIIIVIVVLEKVCYYILVYMVLNIII